MEEGKANLGYILKGFAENITLVLCLIRLLGCHHAKRNVMMGVKWHLLSSLGMKEHDIVG